MRHLYKFACVVFSATILLSGCKGKDGDPGPAGATGPAGPAGGNLTGSIVGFVSPRDEFGRSLPKNGVLITVENTTPQITATTDANGRYELTNVRSGTYNIAYSKTGFGTTKVQGYPHAGGDQPAVLSDRELTGISATTVPSINIGAPQSPSSSNNYDYVVPLTATLSNPNVNPTTNSSLAAQIFIGTTSAVTSATGVQVGSFNYYVGQSQYPYYLNRAYLNQLGFATGTTAYAIMYGAPSYYYDYGYIDTATGRRIFSALNSTPSRVVQFIVP